MPEPFPFYFNEVEQESYMPVLEVLIVLLIRYQESTSPQEQVADTSLK